MLSMKRFFIVLFGFISALLLMVVSFVYFFDVNDHIDWINAQIKQSTGYDIRFEQFENNWSMENKISLIEVSLYQQQKRIGLIKKLDIQIDKIDLWQRQLNINSINLSGVELDFDSSLTPSYTASADIVASKNAPTNTQLQVDQPSLSRLNQQQVDWEKLHIAYFNVTDLNVAIRHQGKTLVLNGVDLALTNLSLIHNQQLQAFPLTLQLQSTVDALQFTDGEQRIQITDLNLSTEGDLLARQAKLSLALGKSDIVLPQQQNIAIDSINLSLTFDKDNLSLDALKLNAFSGEVIAQADAIFDISLFPQPTVKLKQITLQSLIAKDMQILIPDFLVSEATEQGIEGPQKDSFLPVESVFLKLLQLQNINIASANADLPIFLDSLQLQLNDLYLISQNQWINLPLNSHQGGSLNMAFERLNWQQMSVEAFTMSGSLKENQQSLMLLKQRILDQVPVKQ